MDRKNPYRLCTWEGEEACSGCTLGSSLNCRMDWEELVYFAVVFLPGMLAGAAGMIRGGYGWALAAWIGYMLFFFNVWETYVLCRHCPFYGENSRILHCIANHGMIKLWKYQPGPMTRWEQVQFLIGAGLLVIFPLPFLILGGEMLLLALTILGMGNFIFSLVKQICPRCLNFSCPLNRVPAEIREQYLARNPVLAEAWQTGDRETTANQIKIDGEKQDGRTSRRTQMR